MPPISWNKQTWNETHSWSRNGDDWSDMWGTPQAQWVGCILPRIFPFLDGSVLEIACGRGRWSEFLLSRCTTYLGVDLAPNCIDFCRKRFSNASQFEVNDGSTLPMIKDTSIDFVFSFDSLVHVETDAMFGYISELARILKPGAVAFLHHSNLADAPEIWDDPAIGDRGRSIGFTKVQEFTAKFGMSCVQQEIVPWGTVSRLDCMSTIVNSPHKQCIVIENPRFMTEAAAIKRLWTIKNL